MLSLSTFSVFILNFKCDNLLFGWFSCSHLAFTKYIHFLVIKHKSDVVKSIKHFTCKRETAIYDANSDLAKFKHGSMDKTPI